MVRKKYTAMRHRRVSEFYAYWLATPDGKKAKRRERVEMFDLIADSEMTNDEIRDSMRKKRARSTKTRKSHSHR